MNEQIPNIKQADLLIKYELILLLRYFVGFRSGGLFLLDLLRDSKKSAKDGMI